MASASAPPQAGVEWAVRARELGPRFWERAGVHDAEDRFVAENVADLKAHRFYSAAVPAELGGGGASHSEMCAVLRELGRHCGSTALVLSMHQHLVAAAVWRWRNGLPAEGLLRRVAAEELVLVSTGASDWLESGGLLRPVEGGYRLDGRKFFSSGSPAGDLLVTSARLETEAGAEVLHFAVPFSAPGVEVLDNWRTLGMRGTGSNDVVLRDVFVPEASIALRRPAGVFHPSWSVVLTVALPLIGAAYVGVAERAAELAVDRARQRSGEETAYLLGEMKNELATACYALDALVRNAANLDFTAVVERADAALTGKTVLAKAAIACVDKALEVSGGGGFFRRNELERLVRDVRASQFHPLAEKRQVRFSGRVALGLDPV